MRERTRFGRRALSRRPVCAERLEGRTLLAAGQLDPTFGVGGLATVGLTITPQAFATDVALLPDGKVLLAGRTIPQSDQQFVARYTANGTLDSSFGGGAGFVPLGFGATTVGQGPHLAIQPDGKIVAAANDGHYSVGVVRLTPEGMPDSAFGNAGPGRSRVFVNSPRGIETFALTIQPDGRILVGGGVFADQGYQNSFITRLSTDGSADLSFDGDGLLVTSLATDEDNVYGLAVLADGKILAAGNAHVFDNSGIQITVHPSFGVARFNSNGTLDTTFSGDGKIGGARDSVLGTAVDIAQVGNGKFVVAGYRNGGIAVARFNADGSLDLTFGGGDGVSPNVAVPGHNYRNATDLAVAPDGSLLVGGFSKPTIGSSITAALVIRYTAAGELDSSFGGGNGWISGVPGPATSSYLSALTVRPDQSVLTAGSQDGNYPTLRAFTPSGAVDTGFGGGDGVVVSDYSIALDERGQDFLVQPDGKSLVIGFSTQTGFYTDYLDGSVARFNSNGTPDTSFGAGGIARPNYGPLSELWYTGELLPDGKLLLGGTYSDTRYTTHQRLFARLNPNGSIDTTFGSGGFVLGAAGAAYELAALPDGRFLASGIARVPFEAEPWLERYLANGSRDATFATLGYQSTIGDVTAIYPLPDGRFYAAAGDEAPIVGPHPLHPFGPKLFRFNANGTLDTSYGTGGFLYTGYGLPQTISEFWDLALAPDGRIVAAGGVGDRAADGFDTDFFAARFNADGTPDSTFGAGGRTAGVDFDRRRNRATGVAVMPDGKVVIGGETDSIEQFGSGGVSRSAFGVARFNVDGTLDTTFDGDGKVATNIPGGFSWVRRLAPGLNGTVVAVGSVMSNNRSTSTWTVARYRADGSLDSSFDLDGIAQTQFGTQDSALAVQVMSDGSVLAAGGSSTTPGRASFAFARYLSNGRPDASFGTAGKFTTQFSPTGNTSATAFAILPDGRLFAAGYGGMARYQPPGVLVTVQNRPPSIIPVADATAPEGSPLTVVGRATDVVADTVRYHWRVLAPGNTSVFEQDGATLNYTPADDGIFTLELTASDEDGGVSTDTATLTVTNVAPTLTLTAPPSAEEGRPYTIQFSATPVGSEPILSWTIHWGDGAVNTLPGTATSATHVYADGADVTSVWVRATDEDGSYVAHPTGAAPGALDTSFGSGGKVAAGAVGDIAVQPDGKVVAIWGGEPELSVDWRVLRYNSDGSPDTTFGTNGFTTARPSPVARLMAVALQPDGKIVVAGYSPAPNAGPMKPMLARYNANGTLDTTFGAGGFVVTTFGVGSFDKFDDVAVLPDGKIIAGGHASFTAGTEHDAFLARFNPDGSLDSTYGVGGRTAPVDFGNGQPNRMWELAVMPDGRVVFAGEASFNRELAMVRFTANGQLDPTFNGGRVVGPPLPRGVSGQALAVLPDGTVYVAGNVFYTDTRTNQFTIARYLPNGTLDPSFDGDGIVINDFFVHALAVQPDGSLLAGGGYGSFRIARFTPTGALDRSFGADGRVSTPMGFPPQSQDVRSMVVLEDGKLIAGGFGGIAKYHLGASPVTVANVAPTAVLTGDSLVTGRPVSFTFTNSLDPSAADVAAGLRYSYDFNNDSDFTDPGEAENVADASRSVALGAGTHTIRGRIADKDGGFTDYTVSVTVGTAGVVGRHVFYNNSFFDGYNAGDSAGDNDAIAPDKVALRPGQAPTFANVTGYVRGINGVMIDVVGLPGAEARLQFHVAASPDASAWTTAPAPLSVTRHPGAGIGGSDRITVVWPDDAILNRWLRVTLPADAQAGMPSADVSYWGNLAGETGLGGGRLAVGAADVYATRSASTNRRVGLSSRFDHNRDGRVNILDWSIVRRAVFSSLAVGAAPPPAAIASVGRVAAEVLTESQRAFA